MSNEYLSLSPEELEFINSDEAADFLEEFRMNQQTPLLHEQSQRNEPSVNNSAEKSFGALNLASFQQNTFDNTAPHLIGDQAFVNNGVYNNYGLFNHCGQQNCQQGDHHHGHQYAQYMDMSEADILRRCHNTNINFNNNINNDNMTLNNGYYHHDNAQANTLRCGMPTPPWDFGSSIESTPQPVGLVFTPTKFSSDFFASPVSLNISPDVKVDNWDPVPDFLIASAQSQVYDGLHTFNINGPMSNSRLRIIPNSSKYSTAPWEEVEQRMSSPDWPHDEFFARLLATARVSLGFPEEAAPVLPSQYRPTWPIATSLPVGPGYFQKPTVISQMNNGDFFFTILVFADIKTLDEENSKRGGRRETIRFLTAIGQKLLLDIDEYNHENWNQRHPLKRGERRKKIPNFRYHQVQVEIKRWAEPEEVENARNDGIDGEEEGVSEQEEEELQIVIEYEDDNEAPLAPALTPRFKQAKKAKRPRKDKMVAMKTVKPPVPRAQKEGMASYRLNGKVSKNKSSKYKK